MKAIIILLTCILLVSCTSSIPQEQDTSATHEKDVGADLFDEVQDQPEPTIENPKTKEEWKQELDPKVYNILWEAGTEPPFSGGLLHEERNGVFVSAGCKLPVFRSVDKFESGTGWPSFTEPIEENIILRPDNSGGYERVEVLSKCGEHLGHVFEDGPQPTGLRYCINSLALEFEPNESG